MLNNLLIYRLIIANTFAFIGFGWAYYNGFVQMVLDRDASHVTEVILGITLIGIISTFLRAVKVSKSINDYKRWKGARVSKAMKIRVNKMPHKNDHIHAIAEYAVLLGLFGNAVGFVIALSSPDALMSGAGTAFGSTVVGIACTIWTLVNFQMLKTATAAHVEDVQSE